MHKLLQFFNLFSINHDIYKFRFNSNFLETNIVNIVLLLLGLIYVLKNFLGAALATRQEKVLVAIQESEKRLQQANQRLEQAESQLEQTQVIIANINSEAHITAQKVKQVIEEQGNIYIDKLKQSSKYSIINAEIQIRKQIQQQIINLAIHRVSMQFQNQLTSEMQSCMIDRKINKLNNEL